MIRWYYLGTDISEAILVEYRKFWGSKESKIIVGVLGAVLLLIIFGAIYIANSESSTSNISASGPPPVDQTAAIGDEIIVGNFKATIKSFTVSEENSSGNRTAKLEVTARNTANKADSFTSGQFKLRDNGGREYESSIGGFGSTSINPGITEEGTVSFEIPGDAEITTALIRADMFDMGGAEYVRVNLTQK